MNLGHRLCTENAPKPVQSFKLQGMMGIGISKGEIGSFIFVFSPIDF